MILEKVSFDKHLLQKEYWKAKQVLRETEVRELDYWLEKQRTDISGQKPTCP
ncbi:hypothetical protein [Algoriphagus sp.]|uniref:hypothetical protein n=1 Tax=Algoriphagus sp. TaxID=1872435 RepID=UPI003F6FE536